MGMRRQAGKARWGWILIFVLFAGPPLVVAAWAGTEYIIEKTSGVEFCMRCHTMAPMGATYLLSTHGGQNRLGMKARCTDCHLPHDEPLRYIFAKAQRGLKDVWAQWTLDSDKIDWKAKRPQREHFVESGCLQCHEGLKSGANRNHPILFAGGTSPFDGRRFRCIDCHFDVGHPGLEDAL